MPKVGVLALQGAVAEHADALRNLDASVVVVRAPEHLGGVDAVVLPGGETTTMSLLLESSGLFEALQERLRDGLPALGTCAGMILLASEIVDGRADQRTFGAVDMTVRRNAWGRQVDSFEQDIDVEGLAGDRFPAVFIRAPRVERVGDDVEVLAWIDGEPVVCRSGRTIVTAFHPELSDDLRIHQLFLQGVTL
ncbi:MAG TPA: pyridoxal 5'-phosphate synthase glutaminase subunit PdxT [Acidimicrobiales bacterium]|nr:pyridoxal 5'-phosphate synthase glutaminase subunit PdxT [Acidimicrobiales bacterium]